MASPNWQFAAARATDRICRVPHSTYAKGADGDECQLHHVVSDITCVTGMRIIRAIVAGERDPVTLAETRLEN